MRALGISIKALKPGLLLIRGKKRLGGTNGQTDKVKVEVSTAFSPFPVHFLNTQTSAGQLTIIYKASSLNSQL